MLGELTVGHMFVGGGDTPEVKRVPTGLLGADYKIENGRYRFARVYNGENWNPATEGAAHAAGRQRGGGRISAGGERPRRARHRQLYSFFEATAGKSVLLKVGPDPAGANAREVTVVPVAERSAACGTWPGSKTTAARWTR